MFSIDMFCCIRNRHTAVLEFLILIANITKTQFLAFIKQRVQLLKLTCPITRHKVLLLNAFAATSYKLVQILQYKIALQTAYQHCCHRVNALSKFI